MDCTVTNTRAYYGAELFTTVKSFIVEASEAFTIENLDEKRD